MSGHCTWNVDGYGPEVAGHLFIGRTKAEFDRHVATSGWPEFGARQTLEALVSRLGLTVRKISSDVRPVTSERSVHCRCLGSDIPPGSMIGTIDRTAVSTEEGPLFEFTMEGRVYRNDERHTNLWNVTGEPDLALQCSDTNYRFTTCSTLVNRIPDVIAAAPGLCSLDMPGPASYLRH